jgi:transposase
LVDAQDMKAVPGRRTDVKDAEWIADLLRHGLRHSPVLFPPNQPGTCVIWWLSQDVGARASAGGQSFAKVLETANIKLSSFVLMRCLASHCPVVQQQTSFLLTFSLSKRFYLFLTP